MGCGSRETPVESGIRDGTLHVGNGAEPQSLDPHLTTGELETNIQNAIFEGLLVPDPYTGEPSAGAASHWEMSNDQLVYTFHIRPEAQWSDGKGLTAQDFVDTYKRALSPALAAEAAIHFYGVVGASDYGEGKTTDFSKVGFKVLDTHTLQVTLIQPLPHILKLIMHRSWFPLRVDLIETFGRIDERGTRWTLQGNLVGNGPFNLTAWRQNESILVEKSLTYWDADNVKLNRIYFYPIENVNTEERAYRSGRLHITNNSSSIPLARLDYYREEESDHLWLKPYGRNNHLLVNPNAVPFTDSRVRRALSLAINREALAEVVMKGIWTPAYNLVPAGLDGYKAGKQFESDLEEARRLLAEAGYPNGEGFPDVEVIYPPRGENSRFLQAILGNWQSVLGVNVALKQMEWKVWLDTLKQGDYQLSTDGWNINNAHRFFQLFVTGNLESYYLWSDTEYDQVFGEAAKALTVEGRFAKYDQLEKILAQESPLMPLSFAKRSQLVHPSVKGRYENAYDEHPWKGIYLEAAE